MSLLIIVTPTCRDKPDNPSKAMHDLRTAWDYSRTASTHLRRDARVHMLAATDSLIPLPYDSVHVIRIRDDQAHDFMRHIRNVVIPHHPKRTFGPTGLCFKYGKCFVQPPAIQADHHDRRLLHPLRSFMRIAQVERREIEDRRFLRDGTAI